jgi:nucleotide-binding universal stress UspA family protein
MATFRKILVAFDGSAASQRALDEAVRLAGTVSARLRLVHVMDELAWVNGFEPARAYFDDVLPRMRRAGEELLARGMAQALAAGVQAESELLIGSSDRICDQLAAEARRWPADLIVAGTHGRRGTDRMLLGSDAEQIVRHAPVPVLLVRAPGPG